MSPIYLIDGSGYIFRAFYAIRPLSTSHGLPTNALYGFTKMLLKLFRSVHPTHAAIVFDSKEPTFRHERAATYKANRAEPPDDLIVQFPYFRRMVAALNIPQFEMPGYEADDIIGTIATRMAAIGEEVVIITGDKDFMQLVTPHITLWDTMKDRRTDEIAVKERFGVIPRQVVDLQGLAGDAVDNVKGVPGIGEKTAAKLIAEWKTLDNLLEHRHEIPGKLGERLRAHREGALLARELCTIHCEVPIPNGKGLLAVQPPDLTALKALCRELEFVQLLAELTPAMMAGPPVPSADGDAVTLPSAGASSREGVASPHQCVRTAGALEALAAHIRAAGRCALDTETIGLDPRHATLVGVSVATTPDVGYYIPVAHTAAVAPQQLPLPLIQRTLGPVLRDPAIRKLFHHAKFDLPILQRHGLSIVPPYDDTLLMAYLLDPGGSHGLDALAQRYCDHQMTSFTALVGKGRGAQTFAEVPLDAATAYAGDDAAVTCRLGARLHEDLTRLGLDQLYATIELPLIHVLLSMEAAGIAIDVAMLDTLRGEFAERIAVLETTIYAEAGTTFNIASPQQLGSLLFETWQLPMRRRTKTGYSTSADVLEALARHHPLPGLVLQYRSLAKLRSTYIDALPTLIDRTTGRIHTTFNQTVAATGRLSSRDPNLQNIPIRSEEGRRIRAAFVASPEKVLLSADYSQIELRLLAHLSRDRRLMAAFADGRDVHAETAAGLFHIAVDQVMPAQRSIGKTVNFAVLYGQSPFGMSRILQIPPEEARQYIEHFWQLYPEVTSYRAAVLEEVRRCGAVTTLYGRRRPMPEIVNTRPNIRSEAERMAFNTVVQGTAADIIKQAMLTIAAALMRERFVAQLLLQIHDELLFEVPHAEVGRLTVLVRGHMEGVTPPQGTFAVPLVVDVHTGRRWAEC
ncbi:MAG: DNA polymerase I [Deltaproteobacteria bacterium]|nr:DNA polymerase I [Deltaproteobacteria bacterium]